MRYHLLAVVHGAVPRDPARPPAVDVHSSVPAVVEYVGSQVHKRVVAMIETGRALNADEVIQTAKRICRRLERSFTRRGLAISDPELVEE